MAWGADQLPKTRVGRRPRPRPGYNPLASTKRSLFFRIIAERVSKANGECLAKLHTRILVVVVKHNPPNAHVDELVYLCRKVEVESVVNLFSSRVS